MDKQALVQGRGDTRQQGAIAAVREIGLNVTDNASTLVHGHATQVIEGTGLARLNRDAGVGVGRAVVGFVAQQPCLGMIAP